MSTVAEVLADYESWLADEGGQSTAHVLTPALLLAVASNLSGGSSGGSIGNTEETLSFYATLLNRLPESLGAQPASGSFPIVLANDQQVPVTGPLTNTQLRADPVAVGAPAGAPVFTRLSDGTTAVDLPAILGAANEAAAASDTAASGLNGLLKRLLQRITAVIGLLPASLGPKSGPNSFPVVLATDQGPLPIADSASIATSTQTLNALGLSNVVAGAGKASIGVQLLWTGATTSQVVRLAGSMDGGNTWVNLSDNIAGDSFTQTEIADFAAAGLQPGLRYRAFRAEYNNYRLRWVSGTATSLSITWGLI